VLLEAMEQWGFLMKQLLSPQSFWDLYLQELRTCNSWNVYWTDQKTWTNFTLKAAKNACKNLGLDDTWTEYFKIDLLGVDKNADYMDWHLRIAYEHENGHEWQAELCKLSHIIADLRVLVFYDYSNDGDIARYLQEEIVKLNNHENRVIRFYPEIQWLFICGPTKRRPEMPFTAFTINERGLLDDLKPSGGIFRIPRN
jgi:hypothetical protein